LIDWGFLSTAKGFPPLLHLQIEDDPDPLLLTALISRIYLTDWPLMIILIFFWILPILFMRRDSPDGLHDEGECSEQHDFREIVT